MLGLQFSVIVIVIVIAITHQLAFQTLIPAIIATCFVPLSDMSIRVSSKATAVEVLIIMTDAAAAMGSATGNLIIAATAAK
jgi:hypothetical protein